MEYVLSDHSSERDYSMTTEQVNTLEKIAEQLRERTKENYKVLIDSAMGKMAAKKHVYGSRQHAKIWWTIDEIAMIYRLCEQAIRQGLAEIETEDFDDIFHLLRIDADDIKELMMNTKAHVYVLEEENLFA